MFFFGIYPFEWIDETEDEAANKEYVEETNRDAVMIAAAKLVAIDAVPKVIIMFNFLSLRKVSGGQQSNENPYSV